ncbi:MAG: hypothetical protein LBI05_07370 [Planctomycetaceae bacterium]|jgi:hypothetical protein|nr:hypothetical protein [Planctomycetaceae bacterium]
MKKVSDAVMIAYLLFAILSLTSCNSREIPVNIDSSKIPENFDYGTWTGTTYHNDFFGFSITIPAYWHISSKDEMEGNRADMLQGAEKFSYIDPEEANKAAKITEATTAVLFNVTCYTEDEAITQGVSNQSITLVACNLSGIRMSLEEYAEINREQLSQMMPDAVIKLGTNKTIGGTEFAVLNGEINLHGIHAHQEFLFCLKNNYGMTFSMAWVFDWEKEQFDDIMATLTWK